MFSALAATALAMSIVIPPGGAPGTTPPPDHFTIDVVTVNGSGCPAGTAAVAVSPDNKAFTVTYSDFLAQVGVGATPTDFRENDNCQAVDETEIITSSTTRRAARSGTSTSTPNCGSTWHLGPQDGHQFPEPGGML
ncbi:DUF4360 domain-containing protein [Amycolatopsis sp. YIM 10]|uniref:DUF4360 domain-containing protein n=1 Tax=Amycolatopsis sp. YIM 10 TaxID=2653857 RepID=UPI001D13EDA6|nr:DUF4360 domain-containing protein [Amycolatopsis sp. YIM 10]